MENSPAPESGERYLFVNDGHPHSVLLPFEEYRALASRGGGRVRKPAPAEPKRYRLAEETIDQNDITELIAWLETNPHLTQGELVREFERRWAEWLGRRFAVFVNSGSSANLLAYYGLLLSGRLKNQTVIVPAVSWPTTVTPAIQLGFQPTMCDAELGTFGLDPPMLATLVERENPGLVVLVHVLGVPALMEPILELKRRSGFLLIEDACAAIGSRYEGKPVGTFGELATFSFYFGHHLSTIEGGMVVTDDPELDEILRMIRAHGWANDLLPEREAELTASHGIAEFNRRFTFYQPGFNLRSTDLNARIGLSQMEKIDGVLGRRAENHRRYQEHFENDSNFRIQSNPRAHISSISFALMAESRDHRDRIAVRLRENRIETRPLGGGNMSRQPFWSSRFGVEAFPVADRIHETCLHLPNHPGLSLDDIDFISTVVKRV